jgi:hypothetical protein
MGFFLSFTTGRRFRFGPVVQSTGANSVPARTVALSRLNVRVNKGFRLRVAICGGKTAASKDRPSALDLMNEDVQSSSRRRQKCWTAFFLVL